MSTEGERRKKVVILGSTGSIGTSALKVARQIPDRMEVVGLAAGRRVGELAAQVREFGVRNVAIADESLAGEWQWLAHGFTLGYCCVGKLYTLGAAPGWPQPCSRRRRATNTLGIEASRLSRSLSCW